MKKSLVAAVSSKLKGPVPNNEVLIGEVCLIMCENVTLLSMVCYSPYS